MSNGTTNKIKTKNDFNPVKEEIDGKRARRVIWTTKSLQLAIKGIEEGRKLVANPFYENNTLLLKGDLVFERTEEEIEEWKRCKNDIIYFVENYCKIVKEKYDNTVQFTKIPQATQYRQTLLLEESSVFNPFKH